MRAPDGETEQRLYGLDAWREAPYYTAKDARRWRDSIGICALYKERWQVEIFFKWIKQHLRIKRFFGTSENAVKSQIWIAVSAYVLVALVKKRLQQEASLHTLLQILSVTLFEKTPIQQAFSCIAYQFDSTANANQLNLFEF